ncbi:dicarboxylate/amino acid:cation symporter [Chitinophaga sp.]|uniref:dicarboxylate/amino acid:cation symporter n=1 Tax=Chitinophaga sp. TaxID=1869181 RepID=UPI0031E42DE2
MLKNYRSIIWLLVGIIVGSLAGIYYRDKVAVIKPLGDLFLNLLFTAVIPMVFFAVADAVARLDTGKIITLLLGVFAATVSIAAIITIVIISIFPVTHQIPHLAAIAPPASEHAGDQLVHLLTVEEFYGLLSRKNMLALLIFSILLGIAARRAGESGAAFRAFLHSANEVMKQLLSFIMKLAPIGLGAYFAYQTGIAGPQLFGSYAQALVTGYIVSIGYYLIFFSLYAFIAGGWKAVGRYWKNNLLPSAMALGTCSSVATIPANRAAAEKMDISPVVADMTIPLGAALHKEGSAIAAVIKVAVAFALVGRPVAGIDTWVLAFAIALLVSIIEGGIPNGGYVGQLLIVGTFHLPMEVLPVIMIIGTLLDPIATLLNATGDTAAGLLIDKWFSKI